MPMTESFFKSKMIEISQLLGFDAKRTSETSKAIYDRIKWNYLDVDLDNALSAMLDEDVHKLTYPLLKRQLNKFKFMRVNSENLNKKIQATKETAETLKQNLPIREMVDAITSRDPAKLKKYSFDAPLLKSNAVVVAKDGTKREIYINTNQPGFDDAITRVQELDDKELINRAHINLSMVDHKVIEKNLILYRDDASEWEDTEYQGWEH